MLADAIPQEMDVSNDGSLSCFEFCSSIKRLVREADSGHAESDIMRANGYGVSMDSKNDLEYRLVQAL